VDAVLLIAAVLAPGLVGDLVALTRSLGMDALVEVHDAAEVQQALAAGAELLGVNNRDLRTFDVDLATTERLRAVIPDSVTLVAESGVHTPADVRRMQACGVSAILIGEALVTAADPVAKIHELFPHARA
jgi:indole-3-glycerol phosphate synthase